MVTERKLPLRVRIRRALGSLFEEARKLERRRRRRYLAAAVLVCAAAGGGGFLLAGGARGSGADEGKGPVAPAAKESALAAARPLTSILAVLRRPQTAADLPPAMRERLARLSRGHLPGLFGSPVPSLARFAGTAPWGQRIYLVPYLPPTAKQAAQLPAAQRPVVHATTVVLSIIPLDTGFGITPEYVKDGGAWQGNSDEPHRFVLAFPDGVARVEIWPSDSVGDHPHPLVPPGSKPIVRAVRDNVVAFQTRRAFSPGRELWYGPSGKVVKVIANASSCAHVTCA